MVKNLLKKHAPHLSITWVNSPHTSTPSPAPVEFERFYWICGICTPQKTCKQ